jgi:hypothetical protein
MNDVMKSDVMPIEDLKKNINLIQKVLRGVMIKGTHYDVVPGCGNKETLLKPGAEKILSTFRIGVNCEVMDLGNADERRYRVTAKGFHIPTGNPIGEGIGECSTAEKKYQWREAICDKEYEETNEDRRQIMYKKEGGYKAGQPVTIKEIKQIRTSPADIANTVLKMAKKRAVVDLCLSATACSDIFTQDLEDDAPESTAEKPQTQNAGAEEKQESKAVNPISEAQAKRLFAIMSSKDSKHNQEELKNHLWELYGITTSREIDRANYQAICDWIEGK